MSISIPMALTHLWLWFEFGSALALDQLWLLISFGFGFSLYGLPIIDKKLPP